MAKLATIGLALITAVLLGEERATTKSTKGTSWPDPLESLTPGLTGAATCS